MDLVARLKSVAANLIIGALSTLAAVFIYLNVWVPLNFVFGFVLALWGLLHVYRAVTFKLEPRFLPREQPMEAKIAAQHAGEVERRDRCYLILSLTKVEAIASPRSRSRTVARG